MSDTPGVLRDGYYVCNGVAYEYGYGPYPALSAPQSETVVTDPSTGGRKGQKLAQFSQIPPDVLLELAEHYGRGVSKYPDSEAGEPNWQRGYSWRLSVDALGRHLLAFLNGEDIDPDGGGSHLTAVMWHAMTLRYFQLHGRGRDYRPGHKAV